MTRSSPGDHTRASSTQKYSIRPMTSICPGLISHPTATHASADRGSDQSRLRRNASIARTVNSAVRANSKPTSPSGSPRPASAPTMPDTTHDSWQNSWMVSRRAPRSGMPGGRAEAMA